MQDKIPTPLVRANGAAGVAIVGITVAFGNRYALIEVERGAETSSFQTGRFVVPGPGSS